MKKLFLVALFFAAFARPTRAAEVQVAVASNFTGALDAIAAQFAKESGHKLVITSGASGKLYAQIKNGAPFEVFMSADQENPKKLVNEGQAEASSRMTYAFGALVLWSKDPKLVDSEGKVLLGDHFKHLAIANPKLAPYGVAAQEVMTKNGVWPRVQSRLVMGENIAQTQQFVVSGNAELGFLARSQITQPGGKMEGSSWTVPADLYSPIRQDAVVTKKGAANPAAAAFVAFLKGDKAKAIMKDFGYSVP